jgi:hypothetical protein
LREEVLAPEPEGAPPVPPQQKTKGSDEDRSAEGANPPPNGGNPNEGGKPPAADSGWVLRCGGTLRCSPDYGTVWRGAERFSFTPNQRAAVKHMVEAWEYGHREVTNTELLDAVGSDGNYIRDVFRSNGKMATAWNNLIVEVEGTKSTYTLRLTHGTS